MNERISKKKEWREEKEGKREGEIEKIKRERREREIRLYCLTLSLSYLQSSDHRSFRKVQI